MLQFRAVWGWLTQTAARRRWAATAAVALSALLAIRLLALVTEFALPVPRADHWGALRFLLDALDRDEPLLRILWSQHNEHRIAIDRLVDLAVLRWGGGNFRYETYLSVGLAAAAGGLAWWRLAKDLRAPHPVWAWWILPGTMALALSPAQMENWIHPFHLVFFTHNLSVLGGLVLIGSAPPTVLRMALAVLCGLAATTSMANGLLFWPVAGFPLWVATERARRLPVLAGWIGLSAVVWGVYLWGFTSPGGHPSLLALLARPGEAIRFFLALLGNPVGAFVRPQDAIAQTAVPALGAAGLALFGWILLRGDRRRFLDSRRAVWIGLAAHALLSAAAITLARVGFGLAAAFPTRYITFFWPFWLGTLALLTVDQVRPGVRVPPGAGPAAGWPLAQAAWAALIVMCLVTYNTHVQRWRPFSRDIQAAVFELPDVCQGNAILIGRIAAPDAVAEGLPVLMRHGLLRLAPQAFVAPAPVRQEEPPGAIESVRLESGSGFTHSGPCLRIAGHLSRRAARGTEVLLVGANQVLKRGGVGPLRPRTGPDFDQDPDPETGWVLYIGTERMPQGLDRLDVYTVLPDRQAVRIGTVEFPLKLDPGAQFRISQAGPGPSSIAPEPTYAVESQERAGPSK